MQDWEEKRSNTFLDIKYLRPHNQSTQKAEENSYQNNWRCSKILQRGLNLYSEEKDGSLTPEISMYLSNKEIPENHKKKSKEHPFHLCIPCKSVLQGSKTRFLPLWICLTFLIWPVDWKSARWQGGQKLVHFFSLLFSNCLQNDRYVTESNKCVEPDSNHRKFLSDKDCLRNDIWG